ncbi:LRR receptor-like serine/threonine-protein kinase RCH1 [Olea europaea var. sylvestris]|uniref:LRR receptor-like serine/threonine-protein kinase RCH1 n=1 Tax=Olea europaea var. sylvestris TaxID=158386 RepID=UPI000C1D624A|nr:LRR receptor-like serine/threonine-protein kinase RCH1 [Olea europaea var. sylvestris]
MVMKPRTLSVEPFKKAFVFLLHTFLLSSLPFALNTVSSKKTEAEALIRWKNTLSSHDSLDSWALNNITNLCSWKGVVCNTVSLYEIYLPDVGLNGTLDQLDFSSFPNLTSLKLRWNHFHGLIPYQISDLRNLTYLDLSFNSFTGEILDSLFTNLGKLEYLNLTGNSFQGSLLSILTKLTKLKGKLGNLQYLGLLIDSPHNSTIPFELGLCTNLTQLILSGRSLTGSLPLSLTNLTKLSSLPITDSNLCGHILPYFLTNWTQLTVLMLKNNSFTGEIPFEIGLLTNLTYLNLSGDRFSGYIPQATKLVHPRPFSQLSFRSNTSNDLEFNRTYVLVYFLQPSHRYDFTKGWTFEVTHGSGSKYESIKWAVVQKHL